MQTATSWNDNHSSCRDSIHETDHWMHVSSVSRSCIYIHVFIWTSFLSADIRAECPVLMLAFLSLSRPQAVCVCVCVYQERRAEGHVCGFSTNMCVCLFDWLTLLASPIWTIKSAFVLRQGWYDGWSLFFLPPPRLRSPDLDPKKREREKKTPDVFFFLFLFSTSYRFNPAAWLWGRTVRGSAEEAVCKGVNPARGGSRWRLFCSHGSVSESTPMQLHQLAPTHHTLTTHTHTRFLF